MSEIPEGYIIVPASAWHELVQHELKCQELAAQVEALREMANRANVHLTKGYAGQSFSAIDCNLALSALAEIDSFTPQRHLAEIRAQAGRDGFIEGVRQEMLDRFGLFYHDTIDRANQYADSIRQGDGDKCCCNKTNTTTTKLLPRGRARWLQSQRSNQCLCCHQKEKK